MSAPRGKRDITRALELAKKILKELTPTEFDTTDLELQIVILDELDGRRSRRQKAYRRRVAKAKKAKAAKKAVRRRTS